MTIPTPEQVRAIITDCLDSREDALPMENCHSDRA